MTSQGDATISRCTFARRQLGVDNFTPGQLDMGQLGVDKWAHWWTQTGRRAKLRLLTHALLRVYFCSEWQLSVEYNGTVFNTLASRLNECTCALCSSMATFIKKQKGGEKLLFEGYACCVDRKSIERTTWRCEKRTCKGRARTTENETTETTPHNHAPDPERNHSLQTMSQLVERAGSSNETP